MNRLLLSAAALLVSSATNGRAAEVVLGAHKFTLPAGFTIEAAATTQVVPRPVAACFDPQGRLYVTDSAGLNERPAEQLKHPQNRILRLEDTDGDGRFDKSSVFADQVMFPQGCLWHGGSVYVAGPPSIWKFTDTDGDGVADKREEWYAGKVLTGCANDVHGPYLGPEGMLYWTKGAFERLDLKDHRGRAIHDRCAHVFRAWPDGSGFETVMSGGMDNPVEVAFTPEGEPIIISTFIDLSQPGRRDGLAHAVYGGVFGKINDVIDEPMVPRTGDLLPAMTQLGPAAACALMRYEGDAFGPEYRDNLFGTLFNLRKVTRHILQPQGATYRTEDSDFVVSDQMDFHPTDVLQDIDGSLLVVDTGGWYKLCCPSSQLAKADVLGGIYRVRKTGDAAPVKRLTGQERAAAYARLAQPPSFRAASQETELKKIALKADPRSARFLRDTLTQHAPEACPATGKGSVESARLARLAAEGLGRIGDQAAVPLLIQALVEIGGRDRYLEHSLLYALIEIGDVAGLRSFSTAENPAVRRAALLVLDQIGNGQALASTDVAPWLNAPDKALRETAQWIARRHPQWGGELAGYFRKRLTAPDVAAEEKASWEGILGLLSHQADSQQFLAEAAVGEGFRTETRLAAIQAMSASGVKTLPVGWRQAVQLTLSLAKGELRTAAVRAARSLPLPKEGDPDITAALRAIAKDAQQPLSLRLDAISSYPAGSDLGTEFVVLLQAAAPDRLPTERLAAANALARLKPTSAQLEELVPLVAKAGPLELQRELAAFAGRSEESLGQKLVASLRESKALRALRPEDIKPHLAKFPPAVQQAVDEILVALQSDASRDRAKLDALSGELAKLEGNIRRGQAIFNSTKAACSSCHRLGYLGGDLGPDLTSIGTIRTERDLLEAVVYPSMSFVRSYEPWVAEAKDGEEYSGVLRRDTPEEIVLATGPGAETRIARANLANLRLASLSIMPAGLDEQLTKQELADLMAFLKNTKWGVN